MVWPEPSKRVPSVKEQSVDPWPLPRQPPGPGTSYGPGAETGGDVPEEGVPVRVHVTQSTAPAHSLEGHRGTLLSLHP